MKITDDCPSVLPRSIGRIPISAARCRGPNLARLTQGRAQFVSDVVLPRMAHVAFVRSPHAHARIVRIATDAAKAAPGVIAVVTGAELAKVMTPWVGVLTHLKGIKSAPQYSDRGRACLLAGRGGLRRGRAHARRSRGRGRAGRSYVRGAAPGHRSGDRARSRHPGDPLRARRQSHLRAHGRYRQVDKGFADPTRWSRPRSGSAATPACASSRARSSPTGTPARQRLTVYQGTQAPHMMQNLFAKHLGIAEHQVRVVTKDVGGSFGIKVHTYADEMATVALSKLFKRPIKFVADRIESFVTDIHARDHRVHAKIGVKQGRHHHRLRDRRPHRHRPLFGLSAHQRHRGEPDRQPHRRPLQMPELPRPRPRRVPEQERDVPVPRGRPPDRGRGDRGAGRARGRHDRHGPAGAAPPQPHSRRRLSGDGRLRHQIRAAVAPRGARQPRRHDELRRPARRTEAAARAKGSIAASALPPSSR